MSITKPHIYDNKWYIFPDTTLSNLNLNDCDDTVNGVCQHTDTIEQCIDVCKNDPDKLCDGGYFIEANDKNYCVPLRSYITEQTYPYYRFRRKDIYPELENVKSTMFMSTKYPYPPKLVNRLFYTDNLFFENIKTGLQLGIDSDKKLDKHVVFSTENPINVQLIPLETTRSSVEQYIMVNNGDSVAINIPETAFILTQGTNGKIEWLMRASGINTPDNTFKIFSSDSTKKVGEPLNYSEQFYFVNQENRILIFNDTLKILEIINRNFIDAKKDDRNMYFKLKPNVEVYYCNNDLCTNTVLKDAQMNGDTATINGVDVVRSPTCWGQCLMTKEKISWKIWALIVLIILSAILVCITYVRTLK